MYVDRQTQANMLREIANISEYHIDELLAAAQTLEDSGKLPGDYAKKFPVS
jgi:hypothetical protein